MSIPQLTSSKYSSILGQYKLQYSKLMNPLEEYREQESIYQNLNSCNTLNQVLFDIQELILVNNNFKQDQSAHLNSVIDLTQYCQIQYQFIQDYQNAISKLDFRNQEQQHKQTFSQDITDISQLNTTQIVGQKQTLFKTFFKQRKMPQTLKLEQSSIKQGPQVKTTYLYSPKKHQCRMHNNEELVKSKTLTKYKNLESSYSPKRLNLYLNKNYPNYSNNSKWVKNSTTNRSTSSDQIRIEKLNLHSNFLIQREKAVDRQSLSIKHMEQFRQQKQKEKEIEIVNKYSIQKYQGNMLMSQLHMNKVNKSMIDYSN